MATASNKSISSAFRCGSLLASASLRSHLEDTLSLRARAPSGNSCRSVVFMPHSLTLLWRAKKGA